MGLIKGVPVTLITRQKTGVDGFGAPIYEELPVVVDNVLICQPSPDAAVSDLQLFGKHIAYMLCIPKGDTHNWTDCAVEFFGERFRSYGYPAEYINDMVPLDWNKQVKVERYG